MRLLLVLTSTLLASVPSSAQTIGVPGTNDFTINGTGSGATSPAASELNYASNTFSIDAVSNAALLLAHSPSPASAPAIPIGTGTVDIDIGNFSVILDGAGALVANDPLAPLARTNGAGLWSMSFVGGGAITVGASFGHFQAVVFNPTTGGVQPTQSHAPTGGLATWATPGDDDSLQVFLSSPATFYGVAHSEVFVNSNGSISFVGGETDFLDNEAAFLANNPRIAVWEDFEANVPSSGSIQFGEVGTRFTAVFNQIDNWASGGDINDFSFTIDLVTGEVTITVGQMDLAAGNNGLPIFGITPGGGLSLSNSQDVSSFAAMPFTATNATDAVYEDFNATGTFDLVPTMMSATVTVTFTPATPGVGPYTGS